jgi:hypothetical protein
MQMTAEGTCSGDIVSKGAHVALAPTGTKSTARNASSKQPDHRTKMCLDIDQARFAGCCDRSAIIMAVGRRRKPDTKPWEIGLPA